VSRDLVTQEQTAYFDRACCFFQCSGFASSPGSYFVHNKNCGLVRIGIGCGRRMTFSSGIVSLISDKEKWTREFEEDGAYFCALKAKLDADTPCFFLISGDLQRACHDENLPLMIFVQPLIEFRFSAETVHGEISYAKDLDAERDARKLLSEAQVNVCGWVRNEMSNVVLPFADVSANWERLESDEAFLERLEYGIQALQDYPEGKMTMMRSFQRRLPESLNRFDLYRMHARDNGEYAFSHFFCLDEGVFSLGCSPENTFEIIRDELHVDVVAATCKSGRDDEFEKRELTQNTKQIKEHMTTAETREGRYAPFCVGGSMTLINRMQIKRLRNVCHLHSLLFGRLRPQITMFEIIPGLFPIMGARPKDLLSVSDSEKSPHRFYGGIVGVWGSGYAGCFLNLRNALIQGDMIHAKVGMGVLRESDACSELTESEDKISGLMEAVFLCCRETDGT